MTEQQGQPPIECELPLPSGDGIDAVLGLLATKRGIDLRDYQRETIARRLALRIAATGTSDTTKYLGRLESDPSEPSKLLSVLLIPVTSFFRDPPVFRALQDPVLPKLVTTFAASPLPLRAWVIGVATGEEAYSLAVLLSLARAGQSEASFEVLATDIDSGVLETARKGSYPAEAAQAVPVEMRAGFLETAGPAVRVVERIRGCVRFCEHDLMGMRLAPKEAVIAVFQVVMLRNVLIYFDRRLQERAIERAAAVLVPGGILVLGPAETLPPSMAIRFRPYPGIDPKLRIFIRTELGA
ncbi:MAG: protein-glutamate O-methyltransferase CheR [Deltaproteobacteria bacterium]|nr:protein-glutamate O-methyltransferase CheR [Deltaproteobacteria bacterium]